MMVKTPVGRVEIDARIARALKPADLQARAVRIIKRQARWATITKRTAAKVKAAPKAAVKKIKPRP